MRGRPKRSAAQTRQRSSTPLAPRQKPLDALTAGCPGRYDGAFESALGRRLHEPHGERMSTSSTPLIAQIQRRRTFAIISHPDAGKTTLTEKLLLYGGAIHTAGAVKARGEARRARSDWMKIEQQRGISVTTSVMTFEYGGAIFNLLDTPGHEDFSEDTYRTLTAVDSAVMV